MPRISGRARRSPVLCRQFRRFNRCYFGTRLPAIPVIWHKPFRGGAGQKFAAQFLVLSDGSAAIIVNPELRARRMWRYIDATLLHEMVHADLWHRGERPAAFNGHGPKFQDEMLRLAQAGAFRDLW